jgi:hypothetical protein
MEQVVNVGEKTTQEWLNLIKDKDVRDAALIYAEANGNLQTKHVTMPNALFRAFRFSHSEEGFDYWENVLEKVRKQWRKMQK